MSIAANIISREELINEYVQLMKSGNATMFIGAGLSIDSGYPSWNELLRRSAMKLGLDINNIHGYDYYDLTDWYCQFNSDRATLIQHLVYELNVPREPSINHRIIARLPLTKVWTTNFDRLIETAFRKQGRATRVIKRDKDFPFSELEEVKVYKVHGCIGIPDDVVITRDDLNSYYRKYEVMSHAFFSALAQDCFLFLGFGFQDENFKTIIGRISANYHDLTKRHFAVLKRPDDTNERKIFEYAINNLSRKGVKVCIIESYDEIPVLLKDIEKKYIRSNIFIAGSFDKSILTRKLECPVLNFTVLDEERRRSEQQSTLSDPTIAFITTEKNRIAKDVFPYRDPKKIFVQFLERLGEELMDRNLTLYTGFGQGVCDIIIEGASKKFIKRDVYQSIVNKLKIFPLPHKRDIEKFHNQFYRENMIGACGVIIITRGATHASDYTSGTFEEYNIAKGLSSLLTGRQKSIFQEIKLLAEKCPGGERIPITTRFLEDRHIVNLMNAGTGIMESLRHQQAKLVYYKWEEQIEIFYRLFYEQWKLVIRSLDACKFRLDMLLRRCIDANAAVKWSEIKIKLERLVYNRANFFYGQFSGKYFEFDHHFDGELLDEIARDLTDFKIACKGGFTAKKDWDILRTLLNAVRKLLAGDYKYMVLHYFIYELAKTEHLYLLRKYSESNTVQEGAPSPAKVYVGQYKSFVRYLLNYPLEKEDELTGYPNFFYFKNAELSTLIEEGLRELGFRSHSFWKDCPEGEDRVKFHCERIFAQYRKDVPANEPEEHQDYLVCKIQFYKYVYLLCNFEKSLRRLETNQQIVEINKPDPRNIALQNSLAQNHGEPLPEDTNDRTEILHTDPLLYFPNDLRAYIDLHKKYLLHFDSSGRLLKNMIEFKDSFQQSKESRDYKNFYFNICRNIDEINRVEADSNLPYKSNPYRPGTLVVPIATFGGMARKIWKEERIRFDYLCSSADFALVENEHEGKTVREQLLACYFRLFTTDFSQEAHWGDEELEQHYIKLFKSIFYIIEKSQVPPRKSM